MAIHSTLSSSTDIGHASSKCPAISEELKNEVVLMAGRTQDLHIDEPKC